MNDIRVIKKYPNRRLYDTNVSRYITLEEVRQLVLGNIKFRVEDKRTREDITRSILLQIILEEESGGVPMFSTQTLSQIIRFYGHAMQGMMGTLLEKNMAAFAAMQTSISRYLELSMQLFMDQNHNFAEQLRGLLGQAQHPVQRLKEIADRQAPIWRSVRKEFLKNLSRAKVIKPLLERTDEDGK